MFYPNFRSREAICQEDSKMELSTQIRKHRTDMKLSQEELADKVYVTRQTISNWENNKSYPDINSLLLLSTLFNISLDQLIKGDIDIMKEEIKEAELKKFNHYAKIFTILLITTIISVITLTMVFNYYGLIISALLFGVTFFFAHKVEKLKKENDVQTYKEILAFTEGKRLDEIEKHQEYGKRSYQKILLALGSALITFFVGSILYFVCSLLFLLLKKLL